MLTMFQSTRKPRSRNAKVRARRITLESLETRQLLNGSVVMNFGQTLHQVAPTSGVDAHGATVAGSYSFTTPGTSGPVDVGNQLLHASVTPYNVTETFTPTGDAVDAVVDANFSVTVNKANWQITANNIDGTYNGNATTLDGTIAVQNGGQWQTFTESSSGAPSSANAYMPTGSLTYDVNDGTTDLGNLTSLTHAGNYTITPHVDTTAQEWDHVTIGSDINFSYATSPSTAHIAKATSSVTVSDNGGAYIGAAYAATPTIDPSTQGLTATLDYQKVNADGSRTDLHTSAPVNAGSYEVTAYVNADGDFNQSAVSAVKSFTITTIDSGITVTPYNTVYNGQDHTAGVSYGTNVGDTSGFVVNVDSTTHRNVVDQLDAWSFHDANGNYNDASGYVTDQITQAQMTITAADDSRMYDAYMDSSATPTYKVDSLPSGTMYAGDSITGLQQMFNSPYVNHATSTYVNNWVITDGNLGNNYHVSLVAGAGSITPAPLTITAVTASKTYDGGITAIGTPTVLGLFGGNSVSSLTQSFASKDVKGPGLSVVVVNPGFVVNDGDSGLDYTINPLVSAAGTITAANASITPVLQSVVYGTPADLVGAFALPTYSATIAGSFNNELVLGTFTVDGNVSTSNHYTAGSHVVLATLNLTPALAADYNVTYNPATLTVTKATGLVVTAHGVSKVYDGTTDASFTFTYTGVVSGDVITTLASPPGPFSSHFDTANVGNGKTVTVGLVTNGGDASNYFPITGPASTVTANITARPTTVTVNLGQGKIYGQSDPTLKYTASNMIGTDSLSGHLTRATGEDAGSYAIGLGTLANSNYAVTLGTPTVNFVITAAQPTFSNLSASQSVSYGTTTINVSGTLSSPTADTFGQTVTIMVNGVSTSTTVGTHSGAFSATITTATLPVAVYPISYNYAGTTDFAAASAITTSLTVTKANLTIAATDQFSVFYEGFQNGQSDSSLGSNVSLSQNGNVLTPVIGNPTVLVNYNPVIVPITLVPTSPPNLGTGLAGGTSGGSYGATGWASDGSGGFIAPDTTDGQLVLDTSGHFVVKKHKIFN